MAHNAEGTPYGPGEKEIKALEDLEARRRDLDEMGKVIDDMMPEDKESFMAGYWAGLAIRAVFTVALAVGAYTEAGPWTAAAIAALMVQGFIRAIS